MASQSLLRGHTSMVLIKLALPVNEFGVGENCCGRDLQSLHLELFPALKGVI